MCEEESDEELYAIEHGQPWPPPEVEPTLCYYCEIELDPDDCDHDPDGEPLCMTCFDEHYVHCHNCGEIISIDDSYGDPDGYSLCDDCFHDSYGYCDKCNEVIYKDDLHDCGRHTYCEDCAHDKGYYKCYSCSDWTKYTIAGDDDEDYCESCWSELFINCFECEETISIISINDAHEHGGYYYCDTCYNIVKNRCPRCKQDLDKDGPCYEIDGVEVCLDCYQQWAAMRDGYRQEMMV
jgi:hypothetical protein